MILTDWKEKALEYWETINNMATRRFGEGALAVIDGLKTDNWHRLRAYNEQAIFMQHLSCCEKCYKEWLNLKKTADRKANEGRVVRLSRIKKYSFIGSALAVAVSVAVFLNISHLPYTFIDKSYEEAVQVQPGTESSESIVPQFKPEIEEMEKALPMVPVAVDSQAKERMENRKIPTDTGDESLPKKKGLLPRDKEQKVLAALALLTAMDTESVTDQCRQLLAVLAEDEKSR